MSVDSTVFLPDAIASGVTSFLNYFKEIQLISLNTIQNLGKKGKKGEEKRPKENKS